MATDRSEPRIPTIVLIGAISIAALVAFKFVFDDYFTDAAEAQIGAQVLSRPHALRDSVSARGDRLLSSGGMPIERAMSELGRRGRRAFQEIAPEPSYDQGAVRGWIHARTETGGRAFPTVLAPPPPPPEPVMAVVPDAGAVPAEP